MTIQINGTSGISGVDGSAGTPALQGSDTNTGISFGTDTVNINTGGTTRATVDSSGRVLVGTSSTVRDSRLCVRGNAAGTFTGDLELGAAAGFASIASGNSIGVLRFTESTNGGIFAQIYTEADATPGNNDYPGRLVFSTTADGASSPTEAMRLDSSGNLKFNSGYGSVATAYGARAWVNFNGTGTVAIRASGNVSSITDNGTGTYTINFGTAMPDANYVLSGSAAYPTSTSAHVITYGTINGASGTLPTASGCRLSTVFSSSSEQDCAYVTAVIHR